MQQWDFGDRFIFDDPRYEALAAEGADKYRMGTPFNHMAFDNFLPLDVAEAMLASGNFLWNAGIFLFSVDTILAAFHSRTDTPTQLGGWVQGNPWLAAGGARVILNEVNSANPSQSFERLSS